MSNDLLSRLQAAKTDEDREWIVLEFSLENLEKEIREAVWAAAIPHWFDGISLAALLQKPVREVVSIYKRMQELSFVEVFPNRGHNIHERTRKLLLKHLWINDIEKFRDLSRHATKYSVGQNQNDVGWRVERIYHLLIADPREGTIQIYSFCREWNNAPNYAFVNVEAMVRALHEHAIANRLDASGMAQYQFWDAMIDYDYSRMEVAIGKLIKLSSNKIPDSNLEAEINYYLGKIHIFFNDYEQARICLEKGFSLFHSSGNLRGEASCVKSIGDIHKMKVEFDFAGEKFNSALSIFKKIKDPVGQVGCLISLGRLNELISEFEVAQKCYEEALDIARGAGDRKGQADSLHFLGEINRMNSRYTDAKEQYENALSIYRQIGTYIDEAYCLKSLGILHQKKSEFETARNYFADSLIIFRKIGFRNGEAECLEILGFLNKLQGMNKEARRSFQAALKTFREIGNELGEANCTLYLGDLDYVTGRWSAADKKYSKALIFYRKRNIPHSVAITLWRLGALEKDSDNVDHAIQYYQEAIKIFDMIGLSEAKLVRRDLKMLPKKSSKHLVKSIKSSKERRSPRPKRKKGTSK